MERHRDANLHVLVVWEPMLATDWRSPTSGTLARIPDSRVRQFWDPLHLVSLELSRIRSAKPEQPEPSCCREKGFFWDDAILYAPHARWQDLPVSLYWNGPVWKIIPSLESTLGN